MRESRTAPSVTQNLDRKVSGADKKVVLTSLQSFPRGMECIDPLKLGYFLSFVLLTSTVIRIP
jgi:exocyst complex component 2